MKQIKMKLTTIEIKMFFFICLSVIYTPCLKAQLFNKGVIKGSLVNDEKTPLGSATIFLKNNKDSSLYRTTLSNDQGIFSFDLIKEGTYFLEVSMSGFEKKTRQNIMVNETAPETDLGVIALTGVSKMLRDVMVKSQAPFIERQSDKTVVNVENSIIGAGTTVLEMMEKLPGVQITPDGHISLNGKPGVNVFIDGKATLISSEDLTGLLRGMSSSTIQKIEIMAKPSAKFDAAGNAGIINIVKKKNRKEGLNGSVNGSIGQGRYGKYNVGFMISLKNKGYNLFFNNTIVYNKTLFIREITSDIFDQDNSLTIEQVAKSYAVTSTKTYTPLLGADFYLSKKTSLSFSGTGAMQLSTVQINADMDELDNQKIKTKRVEFKSINRNKPYNYSASMHLMHQIDTTGKQISVDVDYSHYLYNPNQDITNALYDAGNIFLNESQSLLDGNRKLNIYAAKADYSQPLKGNGRLEFGWKSSYVNAVNNNKFYNKIGDQKVIDSSQSDYSVNKENINALYLNINKEYKKLTVEAGLRAEYTWNKGEQLFTGQQIKRSYVQLFPTLFVDYKINNEHAFNIKIVRRTDRVGYADMVPFRRPLSSTTYFTGNPNLRPQVSFNNELNYSFQDAFFVTIGFDFYHDYIKTMPFLDDNKTTVTRIPGNISSSRGYNIDLAYSKKLKPWWSTDNSFSFFNQSYKGSVNGFSLDDRGLPSFLLTTANTFFINKKFSAECRLKYKHKSRDVAETYDAFYSVNLGIKHLLFNNKGTLTINANNIFNSENRGSVDKYKNLNQYWYLRFDTRVVSVNFSYRFGKDKASIRTSSISDEEKQRTRISN
jgi:iron complex outermembrane receptor protein